MKLFRHGSPGEEHPGIVIENRYYNLRGFNEDFTPQFFESDATLASCTAPLLH